MEKNLNVWDLLKDELKTVLEKSNDYLDNKAVSELKKKECYTDITYGTFNTLMSRYVKLGHSYNKSMFFTDYLKPRENV